MSSTEIFYHGTCHLFDKFSLSFLGEGEGKSKFGQGIYITSSYRTAALYAAKAAKANNKNSCYVYTVEVPLKNYRLNLEYDYKKNEILVFNKEWSSQIGMLTLVETPNNLMEIKNWRRCINVYFNASKTK